MITIDKILAASTHLIYDTTTGGFPTTRKINLGGTVTTTDNLFSLKVTSILSPDTSTARGFSFSIGQKHHRVKYSFDYRFVPDVEGETAVMNLWIRGGYPAIYYYHDTRMADLFRAG